MFFRTVIFDPSSASLILAFASNTAQFEEINPDRIRYEITPGGKIAHLLKQW